MQDGGMAQTFVSPIRLRQWPDESISAGPIAEALEYTDGDGVLVSKRR